MSNPTDLIEICFIYDSQRVQTHLLANSAQIKLLEQFSDQHHGLDNPQAFHVLSISPETADGTATHLIDTLTDAIGFDELEEDEQAQWNAVLALANDIDQRAEQVGAATTILTTQFIWNNGGGDDNVFTQCFGACVGGADNDALLDRFHTALEEAGEDHFYGLDIENGWSAMSLDDLQQWVSDNEDDMPEQFKVLIDQVVKAGDVAAEPETPPRRPRGP